jgi:hypothetical protein
MLKSLRLKTSDSSQESCLEQDKGRKEGEHPRRKEIVKLGGLILCRQKQVTSLHLSTYSGLAGRMFEAVLRNGVLM